MERFSEKHTADPNTGCWLWTASALSSRGYGGFWLDGKMHMAHRVSYRLHVGEIPEGLLVLHKCDTPCCVNPAHLFLGTQQENMDDAKAKRRVARGTQVNTNRLTEDQVREIRRRADAGLTWGDSARMAKEYGVTKGAISHIITGRNWRHLS